MGKRLMGDFLANKVKPGDWPRKVPASFFNKVDEVLSNLEVFNGHVEKASDRWILVPGEADASDLITHSFKVADAGGGDVSVEGGVVYDNFNSVTVADTSKTLSNGTNYIYLSVQIVPDLGSSPYVIGGTNVDFWFNAVGTVSVGSGTSVPSNTGSPGDQTNWTAYYKIAEVTVASGEVTNIKQHILGDFYPPPLGYNWIDV